MSRPSSNSYSVGLVSAISLAVIALAIVLVGREQNLWQGRSTYRIQFSRTNGLAEGAPVRLNGVNVGSVTRMRFPPDPGARFIEVKLSIVDEATLRINRATVGRIQSLGMLGDKYVELTSSDPEAGPLGEDTLIASVDPVDYEAILGQSGDIVSNAIEVTALLRQVLTDINNRSGLIGRLISDDTLGADILEDIEATVANVESATARADELLGRVEEGQGALGVLMAKATGAEARESLQNLVTATRSANEFASKLNQGKGMAGRLVNDEAFADRTLGDIERSVTSIAEITSKVGAGQGSLGKLIYDDRLYDDAQDLVSGGVSGGFWRLIWTGIKFFLPPLPHVTETPANEPDPECCDPIEHNNLSPPR